MTRWLIATINMGNMVLFPTSVVEDYMIEPIGVSIFDNKLNENDLRSVK